MEQQPQPRKDIDIGAKSGHFLGGDFFGTDTFNDGMDDKDQLVRPGSTSTESGANYMEDKGPNDRVIRAESELGDLDIRTREKFAREEGRSGIYGDNDAADAWLRKHDPDHPEHSGM